MWTLLDEKVATQHHGGLGRTRHCQYGNANHHCSAPPEDFPVLDNFVGYHVNGDLSMQTPSPRPVWSHYGAHGRTIRSVLIGDCGIQPVWAKGDKPT